MEAIINFVVDWTYQQYQRFGYWLYAPPSAVLLLLAVFFIHSSMVTAERRANGGLTEAERKALTADVEAERAREEAMVHPAPKSSPAKTTSAAPKATAIAGNPATTSRSTPSATAPTPAAPAPPTPTPAAAKSAAPISIADWKKEDFLRARADGDPHLGEAVIALGRRTVGKPAAATFLISLLADPPPAAAAPPASSNPGKPPARPPVGAIVAALVANGSDAARAALRDIVSGKIAMPDDPVAMTTALAALARDGYSDDEILLLTALTAPNQIVPQPAEIADPPGGGPPELASTSGSNAKADELQKKAAAAVRSSGSVSMRLRLARYLVQPDTLPAIRQRLIDCLMDPRSENVEAETILYSCEELDPKVRELLESRFAAWSAAALAQALGLPASQSTAATAPLAVGGSAAPPARGPNAAPLAGASGANAAQGQDVDPAYAIRFLWTNEFVESIVRRLSLAESLQQALGPLKLAGVLPCPSSRAAIHDMVAKHVYEVSGLGDFAPGWFGTVVDPGVLLVLKELPRKGLPEPRPEPRPAPIRRGTKTTMSKTAVKPVRVPPEELIKQEHGLAEEWWIQRSAALVQNWCGRLHRAALATPERSRALAAAAANEFRVPLRSSGHVTAAYHSAWPGRLEGRVPAAARDSLDVRYVRMEEKAQPDTVVTDYRRRLASIGATVTQRPTPRGIWLDAFGDGSSGGKGDSPIGNGSAADLGNEDRPIPFFAAASGKGETLPALTSNSSPGERGDHVTGRKRSIDIVVYKAVQDAPALRTQDMDLVIEILLIEGS